MLDWIRMVVGHPMAQRSRARARLFLERTRRGDTQQHERLLALVQRHADSQFGRDHRFDEIKAPRDFRRNVPIRGYDGHEPYIAQVREGNTGALFGPGTEVLMFAMTSGTTARPKTIPVTTESLADYRDGWTIWGIQAFDAHPPMLSCGLRPILQFNSNWQETRTPAGIPCGAITGLTAKMQNPMVRYTYCMPPATMQISEIEAKYYTALRLSIGRKLGTIIAANPSTILGVARLGDREKETLIRDVSDGTIDARWEIPGEVRKRLRLRARRQPQVARRLEAIAGRTGRLLPREYWPELCFLGNWTGGVMGAYLRHYEEFFGEHTVRDVGLIASEGRMTIPIEDGTPSGLLDFEHHYFEFIPEAEGDREQPETVEASELIEGQNYYILMTTAGGLYRYNIHDVVRCTGFEGRVPRLEFLNKGAHFSSVTGEKLSEHQVVAAVRRAQAESGVYLKAFLLLPVWDDPPYYSLLVEDDDLPSPEAGARLAAAVEEQLARQNLEYENRRATLRLGPIRMRRIVPGSWVQFQRRRLAQSGGTVEQYKQPCLLSDLAAMEGFTFCDQDDTIACGH